MQIDWFTRATRRMTLRPDASYTIGSFPLQNKNGSLLLCPKVDAFYTGAPGPFSLFHLAAETNSGQTASYRPWMNIGVTFTGTQLQSQVLGSFQSPSYTETTVWAEAMVAKHSKGRRRERNMSEGRWYST